MRKIAVIGTFWLAMQRILLASQIGEREVIFRIENELFCLYHFRVQKISKYLIAMAVRSFFRVKNPGKIPLLLLPIKYLDIDRTQK